jgi:putative colanic acid biosynthesis acetyltransferase WcaF
MVESNAPRQSIDLSAFDASALDRQRSRPFEVLWWLFKLVFIQSAFPWPPRLKRLILIAFGAQVGRGVNLRPGINIHFPWKLKLGENVWIGDRCTILNLEPVTMHSNSALAHEVYVAAAGHDIRSPNFSYANKPIVIHSGAWVGTRAYIGPGVTIHEHAVVAAGSVVSKDVAAWEVVAGVPAKRIAIRNIDWGKQH